MDNVTGSVTGLSIPPGQKVGYLDHPVVHEKAPTRENLENSWWGLASVGMGDWG